MNACLSAYATVLMIVVVVCRYDEELLAEWDEAPPDEL
jgi:hypothetical protein